MSETQGRPRKIDVLIINDEADTPSFLNPMSGQILISNEVGKRIIELADGTRSVDEIVTEITREFKGASTATVLEETRAFLQTSTEKGVVEWLPD